MFALVLATLGKKNEEVPVKHTFVQFDDREIKDKRKVQSWHPSHSYNGTTIEKVEVVKEVETIAEIGATTPDCTPLPSPRSMGDAASTCGYSPFDSFAGMIPQAQAAEMMPLPFLVVPMHMNTVWPVAIGSPSSWPQHSQQAPAASSVEAEWTTMILRNIPCNYSRQDVLDLLNEQNIGYDFVYLPMDFKRGANLGYTFVNTVSPMEAERVKQCFSGFSDWSRSGSNKELSVDWAALEKQGLVANINRYQNSPVMHHHVPEEWKPVIFHNGQRQGFPPPTIKVKHPRGVSRGATDLTRAC